MDDVLLRHIPNGGTDRVKLFVDIDRLVDDHATVRGWAISGDRIDQRGFATTTLTHDDDKFLRLKGKRNILKNIQGFADPFVQANDLHTDAFALIVRLGYFTVREDKAIRSNLNRVTRLHPRFGSHSLAVDERSVAASQIPNTITLSDFFHFSMESGYGGCS